MRMDKFRTVALGLICFLVFGSSFGVASQDSDDALCVPVGDILIEPPESVEAKRSPVTFPHSVHFDTSCKTCHHKWDNSAELNGCMTSGCHDVVKAPKKAKGRPVDSETEIKYYKTAYHFLCIDCHKQVKLDNQKLVKSGKVLSDQLPATGPTGCVGCHPKEE